MHHELSRGNGRRRRRRRREFRAGCVSRTFFADFATAASLEAAFLHELS
jgi:hypothetical protein